MSYGNPMEILWNGTGATPDAQAATGGEMPGCPRSRYWLAAAGVVTFSTFVDVECFNSSGRFMK